MEKADGPRQGVRNSGSVSGVLAASKQKKLRGPGAKQAASAERASGASDDEPSRVHAATRACMVADMPADGGARPQCRAGRARGAIIMLARYKLAFL